MRYFLFIVCAALNASCYTSFQKDMTHYKLTDFQSERDCDNNRHCKGVFWGRGECPYYRNGAAGYLIYSTKIGSKNIRHLKELAAESRMAQEINQTGDGEHLETICTSVTFAGEPSIACIENKCERVN